MKNLKTIMMAIILIASTMVTSTTMAQKKKKGAVEDPAVTALAEMVKAQQAKQASADQAIADLSKSMATLAEQQELKTDRIMSAVEQIAATQVAPATGTVATISATLPADTAKKAVKIKKVNPYAYLKNGKMLINTADSSVTMFKSTFKNKKTAGTWEADSTALAAVLPGGFKLKLPPK